MAQKPDLSAVRIDNNAPLYVLSAIPEGTPATTAEPRRDANRTSVAEAIASIMPRLGLVELRVCIHLANLAEAHERQEPGWFVAVASLREIEAATGCTRTTITKAIASLISNGFLNKRPGTTDKANTFLVEFLKIRTVGVVPVRDQGGPTKGVPVRDQVPVRESLLGTTPPMDETYVSRGRADSIDSDRSIRSIEADKSTRAELDPWKTEPLERVASARPSHFKPSQIADASRWIHGYRAKFGKERPHAPDASIVAQFLAVAEWPVLLNLLQELMAERRKPGRSYGWFVAVALQRIHGIGPEEQRRGRAALRVMPNQDERENWELTPPPGSPNSPPEFCNDDNTENVGLHFSHSQNQRVTGDFHRSPTPVQDHGTVIENQGPSSKPTWDTVPDQNSRVHGDSEAVNAPQRPEVSHEGGSAIDAPEAASVTKIEDPGQAAKPRSTIAGSGEHGSPAPTLQDIRQQLAAIAADKKILGFGERNKPPPS